MKSGETWVNKREKNLKIELICKLSGRTKDQKDGFWKCKNLNPEFSCCFSSSIESNYSLCGIYTVDSLPESIIREAFIKDKK